MSRGAPEAETRVPASAGPGGIDEFRIVRTLGRGAMGTVFLAHDTILDRAVALKLVRIGTTEESWLRFLNEARAIARLDHPNVIAIFRAGTSAAGEPYLVQELVRGQSLDRMALPLPAPRALAVATGIARGLAAAHRRGVLHRDVKPSNIMIDEAGTPRLLDFGLAKLSGAGPEPPPAARAVPAGSTEVDATAELPVRGGIALATTANESTREGDTPGQTRAGAILGTPRYMAPEVWRGGVASARSDVYSLGAVMYELLAGEAPFPETELAALERAVQHAAPPPLAQRVAGADPMFAALVMRCLARDPAERPESADEVVYQLERIATGAPAVPEGNPYRGLAAFEADQRAVFFGRGPEITAIVERLRSEALVVVAGDSGIGKSSLCRAGVVPAIAAGALGGDRTWRTRVITLGVSPVAALLDGLAIDGAVAGDPAATAPAGGDLAGERALASTLAKKLAGPADRGLLVFIDQLEELVTLSLPGEAARAAALLGALGDGVPGIKVLVAVRGDYLTRVAALPGLRGVMTRSLHLVRGLSPDDARDAIVAPARAKGVRFESEAMVDALVASVADRPAALPLLQFALSELWARRHLERAVIPARALDEIGGVAGALAAHADRVLTALAAPERAAARRILLALVSAEQTRASRHRGELIGEDIQSRDGKDDQRERAALEALVRGRLVVARDVADGEPVYELAHESLLAAWGTLRGWLDDAAGQRAVRTRLAAAAAEWQRLGRRRELLWTRPQLAEAAALALRSPDERSPHERAFLAAGRRATRLRTALAIALAATIPAAAALTWWGAHHRDQAHREQLVDTRLAAARALLDDARTATTSARQLRAEARAAFQLASALTPDAPPLVAFRPGALGHAHARWTASVAQFDAARRALRHAESTLEAALPIGARIAPLRQQMAETIFRGAELAAEDFDGAAAANLEQRLAAYDDGTFVAQWRRPSRVALAAPGATRIEIASYTDEPSGARRLTEWHTRVDGARLDARLPAGSHLARITAPGIAGVAYPFLVERGRDAGFDVGLPAPSQVPPGFIYVPAGAFLTGSNDQAFYREYLLRTSPLHAETTPAFAIGRHEVTYAEWLTYLRALPTAERDALLAGARSGPRTVRLESGVRFQLVLQPFAHRYVALEGESLRYPMRARNAELRWERAPVSGISLHAAREYAAWLAREGGVPGARLCTPQEWERAARGADGRRFPHGDAMLRDDANLDETYETPAAERELTQGPDEVGSHPASDSPFGVADMSGNASEWVLDGEIGSLRGGSWFFGRATAALASSTVSQPTRTDPYIGVRICFDG